MTLGGMLQPQPSCLILYKPLQQKKTLGNSPWWSASMTLEVTISRTSMPGSGSVSDGPKDLPGFSSRLVLCKVCGTEKRKSAGVCDRGEVGGLLCLCPIVRADTFSAFISLNIRWQLNFQIFWCFCFEKPEHAIDMFSSVLQGVTSYSSPGEYNSSYEKNDENVSLSGFLTGGNLCASPDCGSFIIWKNCSLSSTRWLKTEKIVLLFLFSLLKSIISFLLINKKRGFSSADWQMRYCTNLFIIKMNNLEVLVIAVSTAFCEGFILFVQ